MRYRTVDCCPMAATQKMSCAPLSPLAASSAGSFNNSPVNSGILPTDSPEEPIIVLIRVGRIQSWSTEMSLFKRGSTWWYEFWFAGPRIQESSRSTSKTVARTAEQKRHRELEEGFNSFEDVRQERVRTIREVGDDYLAGYKLRNPQSAIFAEYAIGHVKRLLRDRMLVDVSDQTVRD